MLYPLPPLVFREDASTDLKFDLKSGEVSWAFQIFETELAMITVNSELASPHLLLHGTPFAVQMGHTVTSHTLLRNELELSPEYSYSLPAATDVDDSSILVP